MTKVRAKKASLNSRNDRTRYVFLDQFRGFAMVIMAIYHFCFDLNNFGVLHQNMNQDSLWLNFRAVIVSSFTIAMGLSLFIASPTKLSQLKKRSLQLLVCCFLITGSTYFMNPETFIYFGILHFMLVASYLGFYLIRVPLLSLSLALVFILTPLFYRSLFFFKPFWILTGLSPIKPNTEDFAPFFPWMGTVCLGIFLGFIFRKYETGIGRQWIQLTEKWGELFPLNLLQKLGKHSLLFYMTHQLVLMPLAWVISKMI